ncbi:MAG: ABC transporter permease subunit [Heyndrickxia sp.]
MTLFIRLFGSLLLWCCISIILVLIILIPRDTGTFRDGDTDIMYFELNWDQYKENIKNYIELVKEHNSLGITSREQPVEVELKQYFKKSILILLPALLLSIVLGIWKGVLDYKYKGKFGRFFWRSATWLGQSVPDFFLIFLVQTLLMIAMRHGLPRIDMYGDDKLSNVLLAIFFLSMYPAFVIARYTCKAMEEEEEQDYIKTARAKGVPERVVLWRHMLRNCLPKLHQHFMSIVLTLLSGMFIVELLTSYEGIGTRLMIAMHIKYSIMPGEALPIDTSAVIGFSLLLLFMLLVAQWIDQILAFILDPKRKGIRV